MQLNIKPFLLWLLLISPSAFPVQAQELGLWVWRRPQVVEEKARGELLDFARQQGIGRLLVQVRFEEQGRVLADQDAMKSLIAEAHALGIRVEALDGDAEMGFAARREETLARLEAILAFARSLPAETPLAGVHYDIEPYLSERWKRGEQREVALENVETFAALRERVDREKSGLLLACDIPAFYDRHAEKLTFEFRGETRNFHEHLQDLCDYIGVMSYRRKATGPNSILEIASAELAYGAKIGRKVYVAMETIRLEDEPTITFYQQPEAFREQLDLLKKKGPEIPGFGGILLHHYEGVRALLDVEEKP